MTRTWIFRFQNIEKKQYMEAKREYEEEKDRYETQKKYERDQQFKNYIIGIAVLGIVAIILFSIKLVLGTIALIACGTCGYLAYRIKTLDISYPVAPPVEEEFPDKFGLGIELSSGYTEVLTAIGKEGVKALSNLQNEIDDAEQRQDIVVFNMNDNRITVENNEGIISTGDFADNMIEKEG